jgi:hypothetical protein
MGQITKETYHSHNEEKEARSKGHTLYFNCRNSTSVMIVIMAEVSRMVVIF